MATKKVKKFGRGGDILTGLGAGLAGMALYKHLTKDKDEGGDKYAEKVRAYNTSRGQPEKGDAKNDNITVKKDETPIQDTDERFSAENRAKNASKGRPEIGDATNDNITVKKDEPVVKKVKKAKVVRKAADNSANNSANKSANKLVENKSADNKSAGNVRSSVVFNRANEMVGKGYEGFDLRDKGPAPIPPVSRYVRPPDVEGKATEKKIERNKAATKDRPSQVFPYNKAADEKAIQKAGGVRVNNSVPKGIDLKGTNKDVYGNDTTSVFQKRAAEQRAEMEAKARKAAQEKKEAKEFRDRPLQPMKKGGAVKKMASGGMARSSASRRGDGIAIRGKTRA